jgi:hypothetical protein
VPPTAEATTERDLRKALRELRYLPPHSHAASTYRSGRWRHIGCTACAIEERADRLLAVKA